MPPVSDAVIALLLQIDAARAAGTIDATAEAAVERQFAPSRQLAVYGTLAKGQSNHREVAHLGGQWQRGTVRGRRAVRTHPVFTWDELAAPVPMLLLTADRLETHWRELDAFEGRDYCRILVPVHLDDGLVAIANLYAAVIPVTGATGHRS